jgi:hypothetical protein
VAADETVAPESVNWLFCWGKTGMNSEQARLDARRVFNQVLAITFDEYDALVEHDEARNHRYVK